MIYNYIYNIEKTDMFLYVCGILFTTLLVRRMNFSYGTVLGLVCGLILVYYINDKRIATNGGFIQRMDEILRSPTLKTDKNRNLYLDSQLLDFLDNYKEYYQYNSDLYNSLVSHIDTLLGLLNNLSIGDKQYNNNYETMRELKYKILNIFHSFIHRIPHTPSSNDKFHIGINELQSLVNKHIDKAHLQVVRLNGSKEIDNETKFPYRNGPEPRDQMHEPHYHFF
jgi:hypothetical protein